MRLNTAARIQVVRKEQKEDILKEFIARQFALLAANGGGAGTRYLLVARSPDSPAARAFVAFAEQARSFGILPGVVFLRPADTGRPGDLPATADLGDIPHRLITDLRLLDAHEQIVIGPSGTWTGDCMRRDPARRDAYESYSDDCRTTADGAARTFLRLWSKSRPMGSSQSRLVPGNTVQAVIGAALAATQDSTPPIASVRH